MEVSLFDVFFGGAVAAVIGVSMLVASLVMASSRGERVATRFWMPRDSLTARERLLNRGGLAVAIAGIAVMFVALVA